MAQPIIGYSQDPNTNFTINGYLYSTNRHFKKGLRLKEIGNYFFRKNLYEQAVPYYEKALEFIPNEADISFQLAEIYFKKKLWRLAELYYSETIELLKDPVNFGKSQLNSYLSQVQIAKIYHIQKNTQKVQEMLANLREQKTTLISLYPSVWKELTNYFDSIYPATTIRNSATP